MFANCILVWKLFAFGIQSKSRDYENYRALENHSKDVPWEIESNWWTF